MTWRDELDALKQEALRWYETTKDLTVTPEAAAISDPLAAAFATKDQRNIHRALDDLRASAQAAARAGRSPGLPKPPSRMLYGWHVQLSVGAYGEGQRHWQLSMCLIPSVPIGTTDKWRDHMVKYLGASADDLLFAPEDPRHAIHWSWDYLPS